ncbi:MAG TPA: hypothetical protein VEA69_16790 [Tepidisphaeraceae bacterium]|nr:hypothetical protein [Tepidisphaeraceae bacterium]
MALLKNNVKQAPGGKRPGAGRKPDVVKQIAQTAMADKAVDYLEAIERLALSTDSDKVRLAAYVYLTDRLLGKPKEPKDVTGEIVVRVEGYKHAWSE